MWERKRRSLGVLNEHLLLKQKGYVEGQDTPNPDYMNVSPLEGFKMEMQGMAKLPSLWREEQGLQARKYGNQWAWPAAKETLDNYLTFRMQCRRHARRTNAHSKTLQHHRAAIALHVAFYHYCRVHETLKVTPAMSRELTDHIWSAAELIERAERAPDGPPPVRPKLEVTRGGRR